MQPDILPKGIKMHPVGRKKIGAGRPKVCFLSITIKVYYEYDLDDKRKNKLSHFWIVCFVIQEFLFKKIRVRVKIVGLM